MRSICQGCPLSCLLNIVILDRILRKLEVLKDVQHELGIKRTVSEHTDDITVIVLNQAYKPD